MRISTSMMFNTGAQNMMQLEAGLNKLQNQMSTGRNILTPSDNPVASAQAVEMTQQQSVNAQFLVNQSNAGSQLTMLGTTLQSASDLISNMIVKTTEAANSTPGNATRQAIAADVSQSFDQLLGLANSTDGQGQHVFAGFKGNTVPFSVSGSPGNRTITYNGDDGARQIQVDSARQMDVSASGSAVFGRIPQGNGQFAFGAGAANTGTGLLGSSSAISGYDGSTYQLTFTAPGVYTLNVTTNGVAAPPVTGQTYTSGSDIVLGPAGQQFKINISGTPAAGDTFTVQPSSNQDVFTTLDSMVKALNANPTSTPASEANFQNQITQIRQNLTQAYNNLLTTQTSFGARQNELDSLTSVSTDKDLQYKAALSKIQDLDYTKATTDLASQKMVLEAAQLSFKQVSQMSLFNYL